MCIIAVYQNGERPDFEDIKAMMKQNNDGAGVAYNDGIKVHFKKGFTKPEEVKKYIDKIPKNAPAVVLHARIGTSGGKTAEKTHPFIISNKIEELNKTSGEAPAVFFHNGILGCPEDPKLSDTQEFIKNIVQPLLSSNLDKKVIDEILTKLAGSNNKFCILTATACKLYGYFYPDKKGVAYSNRSWEAKKRGYYYGGSGWYASQKDKQDLLDFYRAYDCD